MESLARELYEQVKWNEFDKDGRCPSCLLYEHLHDCYLKNLLKRARKVFG